MSLADLKKQSNSISILQERMQKLKDKSSSNNYEQYWKLKLDSAKQGSALIRFLPSMNTEELPFVEVKEFGVGVYHKDIGKKKWYIHRSLETIGQKDPCKQEFWEHMNRATTKEEKTKARLYNDRTLRIVYIYVIDDKQEPSNNGKVMKMKVSPAIWEYIESKISPKFDDITPIDVFNLWEGCNFRIRAYEDKAKGMVSYDNCEWEGASELTEDETILEMIEREVKSLQDEIDPTNSVYEKSYDERLAQLREVIGQPLLIEQTQIDRSSNISDAFDNDLVEAKPKVKESPKVTQQQQKSDEVSDEELEKLLAGD